MTWAYLLELSSLLYLPPNAVCVKFRRLYEQIKSKTHLCFEPKRLQLGKTILAIPPKPHLAFRKSYCSERLSNQPASGPLITNLDIVRQILAYHQLTLIKNQRWRFSRSQSCVLF